MKRIGKITCPWCGMDNDVYKEDLGFEEFECAVCAVPFEIPENAEDLAQASHENRLALQGNDKASHVRIMAIGEDGYEWCIKNGVAADNELLTMALDGYRQAYPEAKIYVEEEEHTSPSFRRAAMRELL